MKEIMKKGIIMATAISFLSGIVTGQANQEGVSHPEKEIRTLVVFFDGLRPDYITPRSMPNLYAFSQSASYGEQHHSVYPTVTRVNAASLSTGSYPAVHGLMHNFVYFPEVDKKKALNTADAADLDRITQAMHGHLLTAVSLGEILQQAGYKMMVFSSGTSGQALLQNHKISGGAVINTSLIRPAALRAQVEKEIGPIPPDAMPNTAQHKWITDALIKYGLTLNGPLVSTIWFSDPDETEHAKGVGTPMTMEALKSVDEQFGRIIAYLKKEQLTAHFNIIVSSDHGFITHNGKSYASPAEVLIKAGLKKDRESADIAFIGGGIYVKDHDTALIRKAVEKFQMTEGIGGIFVKAARPGDMKGFVAGTLSFDTIHLDHPDRAPDIIIHPEWNNSLDKMGYHGMAFSRGVAGHGGFSSYEVHIPLLVSGPSFKEAFKSEWPTSNVDIAPTILHIYHLPAPASMDGRVMNELLKEKPAKPEEKPRKEMITATARFRGGTYTLNVEETVLGRYRYIDYSRVTRTSGSLAHASLHDTP